MQIHILALLLFFQSLFACQQDQGKSQSLAASLALSSSTKNNQQCSEKALPTAVNVIFQSADGGQTWQDVSEGLPESIAVGRVYADGNEIYLVSEEGLYHRSTALVAPVWEKEAFLDEKVTNIFPGQSGLYVSSYRNGFFKGMPGTGLWTPMHNALEDKTIRTILEDPNGAIFVGCESGIYKSSDGGNCWKQVYSGSGINSLVASGDVLICANYKGLMRSTDGGEHWDKVLPNDGSAINTKRIQGGFITVVQDGPWQDGKPNQLYTSTDEGKTWQRIDTGLSLVRDIHDIVQAEKFLFCSTDAGISRSADGGKTWELVRARADEKEMLQLAVSGQMVFAVLVFGC